MMCDECGVRPATIRLMSIVNGEKSARNLCTHCMADAKKALPNLDLSSLDNMLASLIAATKKIGGAAGPALDLTCPSCGMTYERFQKAGLLGCAECYGAFSEPLNELLTRIHGSTQHTGHAPGVRKQTVSNRLTVMGLRQQLSKAIESEEYERAAELRDRIRQLVSADAQPRGEQSEADPTKREAHLHDGTI